MKIDKNLLELNLVAYMPTPPPFHCIFFWETFDLHNQPWQFIFLIHCKLWQTVKKIGFQPYFKTITWLYMALHNFGRPGQLGLVHDTNALTIEDIDGVEGHWCGGRCVGLELLPKYLKRNLKLFNFAKPIQTHSESKVSRRENDLNFLMVPRLN